VNAAWPKRSVSTSAPAPALGPEVTLNRTTTKGSGCRLASEIVAVKVSGVPAVPVALAGASCS
jgi:hypothetical protein